MTKKQALAMYKRECEWWVNIFSLNEWDIEEYKIQSLDDCYAITHFNDDSLSALCILDERDDWTEREICETACHEMLELLLAKLHVLMHRRFVKKESIETEQHSVINRLIKLLLPLREEELRCLKRAQKSRKKSTS